MVQAALTALAEGGVPLWCLPSILCEYDGSEAEVSAALREEVAFSWQLLAQGLACHPRRPVDLPDLPEPRSCLLPPNGGGGGGGGGGEGGEWAALYGRLLGVLELRAEDVELPSPLVSYCDGLAGLSDEQRHEAARLMLPLVAQVGAPRLRPPATALTASLLLAPLTHCRGSISDVAAPTGRANECRHCNADHRPPDGLAGARVGGCGGGAGETGGAGGGAAERGGVAGAGGGEGEG